MEVKGDVDKNSFNGFTEAKPKAQEIMAGDRLETANMHSSVQETFYKGVSWSRDEFITTRQRAQEMAWVPWLVLLEVLFQLLQFPRKQGSGQDES